MAPDGSVSLLATVVLFLAGRPGPSEELIERYGPDGTFIRSIHVAGVTALAVAAGGTTYALTGAPSYEPRVTRYSPTGDTEAWGSSGTGEGQLLNPQAIATDGAGNVYVADTGNQRIQVFDPHGAYLTSWGTPGAGPGQFNHPTGIAIDAGGAIYVADAGNHRIQKFVWAAAAPLTIYDDALAPGWDTGASDHARLKSVARPTSSGTASYRVRYVKAGGDVRLLPPAGGADLTGFRSLQFAIYGDKRGGQGVKVSLVTASGQRFDIGVVDVPAEAWATIALPLPDDPALAAVTALVWQEWGGDNQHPIYLDRIELLPWVPGP